MKTFKVSRFGHFLIISAFLVMASFGFAMAWDFHGKLDHSNTITFGFVTAIAFVMARAVFFAYTGYCYKTGVKEGEENYLDNNFAQPDDLRDLNDGVYSVHSRDHDGESPILILASSDPEEGLFFVYYGPDDDVPVGTRSLRVDGNRIYANGDGWLQEHLVTRNSESQPA